MRVKRMQVLAKRMQWVRMREHWRELAFLHVGQMRGCGLRGDAISRLAVTNRVMATFATHSQFTFQINKELKNLTPLNFFGQVRSSRNRPKKRKLLWPPFATHTQFTFQLKKELSGSNRYQLSPLQHSTN